MLKCSSTESRGGASGLGAATRLLAASGFTGATGSGFPESVRQLTVASFIAVTGLLAQLVAGSPLAGQERTFRPLRPLGAGSEVTASVSLGDVNGDGALDVVIANGRHWPGLHRVDLNDGGAAFTLARRLGRKSPASYAVPLADFDGDGDLDVAVGNDRTRNFVFLNDGTGRFEAGATFGTPRSTRSLTLADLDGDGDLDLVLADRDGGAERGPLRTTRAALSG